MSVNNSYQIDVFISDGETTRLNFNFFIFQKENVKIKVIDNENKTTELVYGEDYTVENQVDYSSGGYINLTEAEPQGYSIVIYRETGIVQEINLRNLQAISPTNLTKMFDKLTIICQEINDQFYRSLKFDYSQISLIDQSIPLDEINLKNIDPTVNPNKTVAIVLKYNEETGKYILTTSTRNPDDILTQEATEIVLGMVRLATVEEALEGIEDRKVMTPYKNQAHFESKKATTEEIESGANIYKYLNPAQIEIEKGKILEITRKELAEETAITRKELAEEAAIRAEDDDQLQENIDSLENYLHEYYYQNSLIDAFLNKKQNLLVNGDPTKLTLTDNEETDTTTITVLSDPTKQGKLINGDPNTLSLVDNPDGTTTITALGGGGGEATRPMFELFERMETLSDWRDWKGFVPLMNTTNIAFGRKIYKAANSNHYGYPDFYQKCLQEYQAESSDIEKINLYWKYKNKNMYSTFDLKNNYMKMPLIAGGSSMGTKYYRGQLEVYFSSRIIFEFQNNIIIGNENWNFEACIKIANQPLTQACGIMRFGGFVSGSYAMQLILLDTNQLKLGISTDGTNWTIEETSTEQISYSGKSYIRLSYTASTREYKVIVSSNSDFSNSITYITATGDPVFNSTSQTKTAYSNGVEVSDPNKFEVLFDMVYYKIQVGSNIIYEPGYYIRNKKTGRIYYDYIEKQSYNIGSIDTCNAFGIDTSQEFIRLPAMNYRNMKKNYYINNANNSYQFWRVSIDGEIAELTFYIKTSTALQIDSAITLQNKTNTYIYFPFNFSKPPIAVYGGQKIENANSPLIITDALGFKIDGTTLTDKLILNGVKFIGEIDILRYMEDTPVTTYMSVGNYVSS